MPEGAVSYVGRQLGAVDPLAPLRRYLDRPAHREHASEIRRVYGYRAFGDGPWRFRLARHLHARAWISARRPGALFDVATTWRVFHGQKGRGVRKRYREGQKDQLGALGLVVNAVCL